MTPTNKPKTGILLIPGGDKDGPPPLSSPDEPDQDDIGSSDQNAKCATCYAFRPSDGRCQLNPPSGFGEWPTVEPEDYCCQYRKGQQHDGAGGGMQPQQPPQQSQQSQPPNQYGGKL